MKRVAITLALAGSALLGSVVTVSAIGAPTTEAGWRARLMDCVLVDKAQQMGVSLAKIPSTAAGCNYLTGVTKRR